MYTTLFKKVQVKHVHCSNAIGSTRQTVWMLMVDISMLFSSLSFLMIGHGMMIELPLSELQYTVLKTTMWHLIIVGLCLDEGRSVASKMLGMRVFGFLGKNSFHLYLIQFPTIVAIKYLFSIDRIQTIYYTLKHAILVVAPIFLAVITKQMFDEPLQKQLK